MTQTSFNGSRWPMPIPLGWYNVAYSDELAVGDAKPIHYFGEELVLFRGEDGKARVLDAYCEHLGAHLGDGKVHGNLIECPFHAWRYDDTGACVDIPYAKIIPPRVKKAGCLKSWPVQEVNQAIWVWYHPNNEAPSWDVEKYDEVGHEDWTPLVRHEWAIATHPQEMAENAADPAHFQYVHGTHDFPPIGLLNKTDPVAADRSTRRWKHQGV